MKVAIYGQYFKPEDEIYLKELFETLQKNNIGFVIEQDYYLAFKNSIKLTNPATFSSHTELNNSFDFMFTVGGDGTILRAVTFIRDSKIPIVGINTGRLGFLATVQKDQISFAIEKLLNKDYLIKKRTLLSVSTSPTIDSLASLNFALNEVSVSRKNTASMITVETFLDDEYLNSYWADGLIIATPTGSTGYSLSCGGPIITPQAKSLVITPIAPHNLNARPLVIPDETAIKFNVSGREDMFFLSLDSRITTIKSGTTICIKKAAFNLKMVEINQQTFIKTLREKLLWGQDTRNYN
jgi:NAD+ kinase